MSCCGRGVMTPGGMASDGRRPAEDRRPSPAAGARSRIYFQYIGPTDLTARGPLSGRSYRFGTAGAVLEVDPRDRASLERVPHLRQVPDPDRTAGPSPGD